MKSKEYYLEKNKYGNVDCWQDCPNGWTSTNLSTAQLTKLNIPYYKGIFGLN